MQRKKNKSENDLVTMIEREFGRAPTKQLRLSFGDDAALWTSTSGHEAVLTCDWFLEGTHFLRDKHTADAVGWKCLARAVSDIAAMGGRPGCFLLSLALPLEMTGKWMKEFLGGLRRASKALTCKLAGGDTTSNDKMLINISVIGQVRHGYAILRSGAAPGDSLYVSGTLGEAELGLRELRSRRGMAKPTNAALLKHLYPQPRLALGAWLAKNRLATAMMDLSDGLSTDLPRLCAASGVGAMIDSHALPVTRFVPVEEARELALHGGDDYELLFSVAKKNSSRLPRRFRGLQLTKIGKITSVRKIRTESTARLGSGGWDPFREA
jgi:thiamine-monophosphate kinase